MKSPVDEQLTTLVLPNGQEVVIDHWRDVTETGPDGIVRYIRQRQRRVCRAGHVIDPETSHLTVCTTCGAGPVHQHATSVCVGCQARTCPACTVPINDDETLCAPCAQQLQRRQRIEFFFGI